MQKLCMLLVLCGVSLYAMDGNPFYDSTNPFYRANMFFHGSHYGDAIDEYERVLAQIDDSVDPKIVANAKLCLGQVQWAMGRYLPGCAHVAKNLAASGRPALEKRLRTNHLADISGKRVLVRAHDGIGDTFSFSRYAKILKDAGAQVTVLLSGGAQRGLKEVLARSTECVDAVVTDQENAPDFDYDTHMMALPHFVSKRGLTPVEGHNDVPQFGAYIHPLEAEVAKWRGVVQATGKRPLGICWQASNNPVPGGRVLNRNVPLGILARLGGAKTALFNLMGKWGKPIVPRDFVTLSAAEKEKRKGDVVTTQQAQHIHSFDDLDETGPFEGTIALMHALKLQGGHVVSCDTSIPNLSAVVGNAGEDGVPTIMLLDADADARWGEPCPGAYAKPSRTKGIVEFRERRPNDWEYVVDNVAEYLKLNDDDGDDA